MPHAVISLQPNKIEDRAVADPFRFLESQGQIHMQYAEFRFARQAYWILRGKEHSPLTRVLRNALEFSRLLAGTGRNLIVGAEPFSPLTVVLNLLKRRHKCIYFTSWSWQKENFAHAVLGKYRQRAWRRFLKGTVCVSVNPEPCATLRNEYGARAFHIPHPVQTDLFHPPQHKVANGKVRVLYTGHLMPIKGTHILLDAIRTGGWKDVEFWIVGNGPLANEVQALVKQGYPLRYYGQVRDRSRLAEIYRDADMFVLPSIQIGHDEEKFGMVLLEAMASGLPVIATDCVGPRQIIKPGRTGLLVPQNNVPAIINAIRMLAAAPPLRMELGANGRQEAEQGYNLKVVAAKWLDAMAEAFGPDKTTS